LNSRKLTDHQPTESSKNYEIYEHAYFDKFILEPSSSMQEDKSFFDKIKCSCK